MAEVFVVAGGAFAAAFDAFLVGEAAHQVEGEVAHEGHVVSAVALAQP